MFNKGGGKIFLQKLIINIKERLKHSKLDRILLNYFFRNSLASRLPESGKQSGPQYGAQINDANALNSNIIVS